MERIPIKSPIVVTEPGDADVFETVEAAESYVEHYDVGVLTAYDSEGRLLRLLPTTPRITIEAAEWTPNHIEEAREVLLQFLQAVGESDETLSSRALGELFAIALKYRTR
jgi:hypothetical protein